MKKRLILILVSLLLIGSFAACDMEFGGLVGELLNEGVLGEGLLGEIDEVTIGNVIDRPDVEDSWIEETWGEETWVETDILIEPTPGLELPENAYPGESVTILSSDYQDLGSLEELSGIVHELSYQRNKMVEDAFNIHINTEYCSWTDIADKTKTIVRAGAPDYDIVMAEIAYTGAELALDGCLVNLNTLPYVDMSGSAWDADVNEGLAIGSFLPMATGALVPTSDLSTSMLAFNKQMADEMGVDLYDYVACGGWTLSKMHTFVSETYVDLNGNGQADGDDRFGLALEGDRTYAFACGADVMLVDKDAQNLPVINDSSDSDDDPMLVAFDEFYAMVLNRGCLYLATHSFTNAAKQEPQIVFESGRALLYGTTVEITLNLYETGILHGVLPYPKLNEEQVNYQSFVNTSACAVMVPKSARNHDLAGYALQGLALVSDGLYQQRLSTKFCNSAQDQEMLMLIWDTKTLDFGSNYLIGEMENKVQYFSALLDGQSGNVVSWFIQNQKGLQKYLEKLISSYENLQ